MRSILVLISLLSTMSMTLGCTRRLERGASSDQELQEIVDAYPDCTPQLCIMSLSINADVTALDSLSGLFSYKDILIDNTRSLQSLRGLEGEHDLFRLSLNENQALSDVAALEATTAVKFSIDISGNPELNRIALPVLTSAESLFLDGQALCALEVSPLANFEECLIQDEQGVCPERSCSSLQG